MPEFMFKPKSLVGFPVPDWGNAKAVSSVQMLRVGNRVVIFLFDNNEDLSSAAVSSTAGSRILKALVLQLSSNLKFNIPEGKTPQAFLEDNGVKFEGSAANQKTSCNNFVAAMRLAFSKVFAPWADRTITSEAEKALEKALTAAEGDAPLQLIIKAKLALLTSFTVLYKVAAAIKEACDDGSASADPALYQAIASFKNNHAMMPKEFLEICCTAAEEDDLFSLLPETTNMRGTVRRLQEAICARGLDDVDSIASALVRLLDEPTPPEWDDILNLLRPWSRSAQGRAERSMPAAPSVNFKGDTFPPCKYCDKTNHSHENCFRNNPALFEKYKENLNALSRQQAGGRGQQAGVRGQEAGAVLGNGKMSNAEMNLMGAKQFITRIAEPEIESVTKFLTELMRKEQSSFLPLPPNVKAEIVNRVRRAINDALLEHKLP